MLKTLGTDVSKWQPSIDWTAASSEGVRFAICRATRGEAYVDPMFEKHVTDAAAEDVLTGSYHFFRTDGDPVKQALSYYSVAGVMGMDLPPVIDFEALHGDTAPSDAITKALEFIETTEELWNRGCVVYTFPAFWTALGDPEAPAFGEHPLWIAHWGVETPKLPKPWSKWLLWQFDGDGGKNLPGGVVADFNWFDGAESDLRLFCKRQMPTLPPSGPGAPANNVQLDGGGGVAR
ncbi:MAG: glycoside hydrolase family 25 protein [Polyangiaceae bacterium]